MGLNLNEIKQDFNEYHLQVAQILSGMDMELMDHKKKLERFTVLQMEVLRLMDRMDKLEEKINSLSK